MHALSAVDMKLIALARTIEVEYYGSGHLRDKPGRVRAERKPVDYAKTLPGWGVMGGTLEAIDEINREEEEAAIKVQAAAREWCARVHDRVVAGAAPYDGHAQRWLDHLAATAGASR